MTLVESRCAQAWLIAVCLLFTPHDLAASERLTLNFNPDWKFIKDDPAVASQPGFNDDGWATVSAPHTFNDVDTFDDWSAPGHVGETNQWTGRTWYRKSFSLPEAYTGKRVYLEFEAVRHVAEVYLNGQPLGTNWTGFIPFGFDITPHLRFSGATNVLAVMADNRFTSETELARIAATELPWNSPHWHPAHGGIYRNVYLHVTDPLHISLPLYNSLKTVGPYVYASDISTKSAVVHVEVPVQNERPAAANVEMNVEIRDRDGKTVATIRKTKPVPRGEQEIFKLSATLISPELWDPDYPYLYKAVCSLKAEGHAVDNCDVPFGIRSVRWDAATGFSINGHHLKLHGWGQKPTSEWPGLGAAHPDWMHYYTLNLMKEAGGNFVRWGHCAGAPADLAAADQLGLLIEQPGVDGEGDAKGEAWKIRAAAFREMIVYYRNHPSIIIWEGGNQKVIRDHAKELREYLDTFDPHGGRAYAHRRADQTTAEFMDVGIGTEGGREIARLPVVEGEYDREESPRRVWDTFSPPNFGYPEAKGQTYQLTSEEYAVNQVAQYVLKLGKPDQCGGANWIFSDSTSGGRVACEVARTSGEVDGVRLPKEAFFVCRTMFRSDPQVHIIGHWNYPADTKKTIYVTSNCEDVELLVNGKSLGHGKASDRYLFTFPDVAWEAGEIKAVGSHDGNAAASDARHTVGEPVGLKLAPILGPNGWQADGSDVALVDVEVVDAKGERCPTVQQRVDFDLSGAGIWRGGYNSGKTNSINNRHLDVECGINRVAIRSKPSAGVITLSARSGALKPASLTLTSVAVPRQNGASPNLPRLPAAPKLTKSAFTEIALESKARPTNSQHSNAQPSSHGRFIKTFSYSGPTTTVCVQSDAHNGGKMYADCDYVFANLPEILKGSDWVQTANADKLFGAVDLMEVSVAENGVAYVAHDDRLPRPDWLQRSFKPTEISLVIGDKPMKLFERKVGSGESLTLGSNTENRDLKSCNMYLVFVIGGK